MHALETFPRKKQVGQPPCSSSFLQVSWRVKTDYSDSSNTSDIGQEIQIEQPLCNRPALVVTLPSCETLQFCYVFGIKTSEILVSSTTQYQVVVSLTVLVWRQHEVNLGRQSFNKLVGKLCMQSSPSFGLSLSNTIIGLGN